MIIVEGSDPSEFYRWRYWEEVSAARTATSQDDRDRHLRLADLYRLKLNMMGAPMPQPSTFPPIISKN